MNSDSSSSKPSDIDYQTTSKAVVSILPGQKYDPLQLLAKNVESLEPGKAGHVIFQGSFWRAVTNTSFTLQTGTLVRVVDRQNLTLVVEPLTQEGLYGISPQEVKTHLASVDEAIASKRQDTLDRLNQVDEELEQLKERTRVLEERSSKSKVLPPSIKQSKMTSLGIRGDRMIAMTAGGAFLGGTIGLAPGAVIGAAAGAIFALLAKVD
jgi:membrane-bound ClpP family serine protease